MLLKNIILKKKIINKNYTIFSKKKYIYLILFIWLKIIKQNNYLIKKINFKKLILFTLQLLLLKKNKSVFFNYFPLNVDNEFKTYSLITHIIKITLLKSNIYINITDIKGSISKACSSGIVKLKGSQKTKKLAYNRIINFTKFKMRTLVKKIFAIHFIGTKTTKKKLLKSFKNDFYIKNIKNFNLIAHNGCRLKK
jgi:ribosomal protein S11